MVKGFILYNSNDVNQNRIKLKTYAEQMPFTTEGILSVEKRVYEDCPYELEIESDDEYTDATFFINDERVNSSIRANIVTFNGQYRELFANTLGIVQISATVRTADGYEEVCYSEYASVMVKNRMKYRVVQSMLEFVYNNQTDLLTSSVNSVVFGEQLGRSAGDFNSQINLLKDIMQTYSSLFGYFKANSRCKLKQVEVVDRVEKIQSINARTLQYIVQHPENMKRGINGIQYGKQFFVPDRTLMLRNKMSTDIYENQVVVGFLRKLLVDTRNIKKRLGETIGNASTIDCEDGEYVISWGILYNNALRILNEYLVQISELEIGLSEIYTAFDDMLHVSEINCAVCPKPTEIFISVPQYTKIFSCIIRWFNKTGYSFAREIKMLTFMDVPTIYEAYVLAKLVKHIRSSGFELVDSKNIKYPHYPNIFKKNAEYNNTFIFERGTQTITLYYEPVIYNDPESITNGIALFRNNSQSWYGSTQEVYSGKYYVPDYVIKVSCEGHEKYAICDAKYSRYEKVKTEIIPELQFKYLFSLSPMNEYAFISSLNVLYGVVFESTNSTNYFDNAGTLKICPNVEMIPLSETLSKELQSDYLNLIFDNLIQ